MSSLGAFLQRVLTPEILLALLAAAGIAVGRLKINREEDYIFFDKYKVHTN